MDWLAQYSTALDERDIREQAHKEYIDACRLRKDTKLANKSVSIEEYQSRQSTAAPKSPAIDSDALLAQLRNDLTATQKARGALQAQVTELSGSLESSRQQINTTTQQISLLTRQKLDVERRLRDRDEELRGKAKLAETAQDEMVSLGLQLNMAEQKMAKLEQENAELVERWMKRVGEEAEKVNRDSRWE